MGCGMARRWCEGDKVRSGVVPGGIVDDVGKPEVTEVPSPSPSPRSESGGGERFSREELGDVVILPESLSYRLKTALLGPPLITERLSVERLGKPTALGVLSPDCISSTAYGTEEILFVLVRAVGVAAFSLLLPITLAVIVVLLFVTLSYREVVMVYTRAGGSYVVARENFGVKVAQIAAVALIIDYVATVAVQVAAGTDALTSAFPVLAHGQVPVVISVAVVALMCYGNLRGIREAGPARVGKPTRLANVPPPPFPALQPNRAGRILPEQRPLADVAVKHSRALVARLLGDDAFRDPGRQQPMSQGRPAVSDRPPRRGRALLGQRDASIPAPPLDR